MKKITIKVSNKELDALEDIIYCEIPDLKELKQTQKLAGRVWGRLVEAYDGRTK